MRNPIPEVTRVWLYLTAAVALTIAGGGTIPQPYLSWLLSAAGALLVLASANVQIPGRTEEPKRDVDSEEPEEAPNLA